MNQGSKLHATITTGEKIIESQLVVTRASLFVIQKFISLHVNFSLTLVRPELW